MNLTQLLDRCQARFRDTGGYTFTPAEWTAYLNDVYSEIIYARPDWPFMETRSDPISVTPPNVVTLPADVWRLRSVYNATLKVPLVEITGMEEYLYLYPDAGSASGSPQHYRITGNTLEVFPKPDSPTEIIVEHWTEPAPLSDPSDTPIFPPRYHRLLVEGALQLAYEDVGNLQQSQVYARSKDQGLAAMAIDLFGTRGPNYIVPNDNFFG